MKRAYLITALVTRRVVIDTEKKASFLQKRRTALFLAWVALYAFYEASEWAMGAYWRFKMRSWLS